MGPARQELISGQSALAGAANLCTKKNAGHLSCSMADVCMCSESSESQRVGLSCWIRNPDVLIYYNNEVIRGPIKPQLAIQVQIWFVIQRMVPSLFNKPVLTSWVSLWDVCITVVETPHHKSIFNCVKNRENWSQRGSHSESYRSFRWRLSRSGLIFLFY